MQTYISRKELAARWGRATKTLANWASTGSGPRPIGCYDRSVIYLMADVIQFEDEHNMSRN